MVRGGREGVGRAVVRRAAATTPPARVARRPRRRTTVGDAVPWAAGGTAAFGREDELRAYRGWVREGRVELEPGVRLPEGVVVTVTVGEAELWRATLRAALRRNARRRGRARRWVPVLLARPRGE